MQRYYLQKWLHRQDRTGMAHGIEIRVPFCDLKLIKSYLHNRLYNIALIAGKKNDLKKIALNYLPQDIVYRKNGWTNYRDWLGIKVIKIKKRIKSRKKSTKKTKTFFVKKELNIVKYNLFKKLASHRVPRALNSIKLIGNLSNKSSYEYKEEDVKKIFKSLSKEMRLLKKKFNK